jgi:hypothetical protein
MELQTERQNRQRDNRMDDMVKARQAFGTFNPNRNQE